LDPRDLDALAMALGVCAAQCPQAPGRCCSRPAFGRGTQETPAKRKRCGGTGGDRVLLALYDIHLPEAGITWSTVVYRPRQFTDGLAVADPTLGTLKVNAANAYAGWDFFSAYN
jgi:hypothetical protein